jgi:hypothetical protein
VRVPPIANPGNLGVSVLRAGRGRSRWTGRPPLGMGPFDHFSEGRGQKVEDRERRVGTPGSRGGPPPGTGTLPLDMGCIVTFWISWISAVDTALSPALRVSAARRDPVHRTAPAGLGHSPLGMGSIDRFAMVERVAGRAGLNALVQKSVRPRRSSLIGVHRRSSAFICGSNLPSRLGSEDA